MIELKNKEQRIADIRDIVNRYNSWCEKQFPDSTPTSSLIGLKRECDECMSDIDNLHDFLKKSELSTDEDCGQFDFLFQNTKMEYADILMYVIDSARRFGLSLDDLFLAMDEKLQINLKRSWKINDDKSYSHIK